MPFIKVYCTVNLASAIKCSLKKEANVSKAAERSEQGIKKQHKKEKYAESQMSNFMFQKVRYQENPEVQENLDTMKI